MTYRVVLRGALAGAFVAMLIGGPAIANAALPDLPVPTPTPSLSLPTGELDRSLPQAGDVTPPNPGSLIPPPAGSGGEPTGPVSGGNTTGPGSVTSPAGGTSPSGSSIGGVVTGAGASTPLRVPGPAIKVTLPRADEPPSATIGRFARRAVSLAGPMAAPVGIAILGLIGLAVMAKGAGRLEAVEDEKESLGGWTVIKL